MAEPRVTVVIPTHYRNDQLRLAIESVCDQTFGNVQVVLVDGSEADRHAEPVAKEFGVEYVCPDVDRGAHAARSLGAERTSGDYINFLDDDDRFHPEKLERQVPIFERSDDVGVVYSGIRWDNGHRVLPDPDVRGDVLEYALRFQMTPSSPSTMLIDRAVLDEIVPFRNLHGADDMGMKIELAQRTEFDFVDEPLVYKGDSDESLGGSRENVDGRLRLLQAYDDLYSRFPSTVRRTALAHTHLLDAELELDRRIWSPRAVTRALQACYYVPGLPLSFAGYLLASLLGRPGRDIARTVYSKALLGTEHRGKLT